MKRMVVKTLASLALIATAVYSQNMPFPQQKDFSGCIKPNVTQAAMNQEVINAYNTYKNNYLREAGSTTDGYYVYSKDTHSSWDLVTVSEAHGYGMVIVALMAGYDSEAEAIFDGMYEFYKNHRSNGQGVNLMSWAVSGGASYENNGDKESSAIDGDLDIAYALLLGYKQFGNTAYLNTANQMLSDIYAYEVNPQTKALQMGDYVDNSSAHYYHSRPSDWMGDHLRTFADVTGDSKWDVVADKIYDTYTKFQVNSYSTEGLISDFVYYDGSEANSVPANFLEGDYDGAYSMNACRVPWRFATDYAHFGDTDARDAARALANFAITESGGSASGIYPGYWLDGDAFSTSHTNVVFTAPFVAAAITTTNQSYLTNGWNYIKSMEKNDAYQQAIYLQCLLLISGNWWAYDDAASVIIEDDFETAGIILDGFGDTDAQSDLEAAYGAEHFAAEPWEGGWGWMAEDWHAALVKTPNNQELQGPTYDSNGDLADAGNLDDVFESGLMKLKFADSSAIGVSFPRVNKDDNADFFNLTDMTGFTIRAKGTGDLVFKFYSDDTGTLTSNDRFWGGFYATIPLTSTMTEYQITADLLQPFAYSEEVELNWTWNDDGAPKVRGIALENVSGGTIDVEIDYIELNGTGIDNETFGITNEVVVEPVDGVNVLSYGDWAAYGDASSTGDISTELVGDSITKLTADLDRAAYSAPDAYDTYISLAAGFDGDFSTLTALEITYSSDVAMNLALPMVGETDENGTAHFISLPAGNNVTVTKAISDFKQPSWTEAADSINMDLEKVEGLSIEMSSEDQGALSGTISITSLKLDGASINPVGIEAVSSNTVSATGISTVSAVAGMLRADISLPQAGMMDMMVVNTQGRVVAREAISLQGGVNSLSLDLGSQATGIYYLVANGAGLTVNQKFFLQ